MLSHGADTEAGREMERTALPNGALNPEAAIHHRNQGGGNRQA